MLRKLKMLLGISDNEQDAVLQLFLDAARDAVLSYTNRQVLPQRLESIVIQIALAAFNKAGAEGESGHSEGGISRTYEPYLSDSTKAVLNRYIKARVV